MTRWVVSVPLAASEPLTRHLKDTMAHAGAARLAALDLTEFRIGWRIALLAMLGVAANSNAGLLYAWGSLILPLGQAHGWARADLQSGISFMFLGMILGSQIVGWLNLRFGMRAVTYTSLLSLSGVYIAMSLMGDSLAMLYVLMMLTSIASMGTMHVTWTHLINLWYVRNRGLALALVLSGTGLAAIVIPSMVSAAISRWGWPSAFWLLAAYPAGIVLPLAMVWMHEPAEHAAQQGMAPAPGPTPEVRGLMLSEAIKSPRYWALNLALSMVVACVVTMVTNAVPLLRDKGLGAAEAARIFGGFGLSLIAGRMVVGYLVDRIWAPGVAAVALAMPALGCVLLMVSGVQNTLQLTVAVMLLGIGAEAEFDIAAFLMARYFGMRDYGRLFGVHLSLITAAATLAPWLFAMLYRQTGSYQAMLGMAAPMFLVGGLMLLPLGRYPKFESAPVV
jgi:MFS family permease